MVEFERSETISMRAHSDLSEQWVQRIIAEDPSILGLGDLELRQMERMQPRAGRLDLLLQDPESKRRFEVELQLGPTDEKHIIRTIEYWDIERRRYPQYDHCAVIVAEDITTRFLNVISLFNGSIPLIAIQVRALRVSGKITLIFTKVLDELVRGLVDEDEESESAPTDRAYWEAKATHASMKVVDSVLSLVEEIDKTLTLRYNKHYIGIGKNSQAFNFVSFRPKKNFVILEIRLSKTDDLDQIIDENGLESLDYNSRWGMYKLRITSEDAKNKREPLGRLMQLAYVQRSE